MKHGTVLALVDEIPLAYQSQASWVPVRKQVADPAAAALLDRFHQPYGWADSQHFNSRLLLQKWTCQKESNKALFILSFFGGEVGGESQEPPLRTNY